MRNVETVTSNRFLRMQIIVIYMQGEVTVVAQVHGDAVRALEFHTLGFRGLSGFVLAPSGVSAVVGEDGYVKACNLETL